MVDGNLQALLAAFAAAPALAELHVQLPDHLGVYGNSLVCVQAIVLNCEWSCHILSRLLEKPMALMTWPSTYMQLKVAISLLQSHLKLLGGLTKLHMHGVSPPMVLADLNSLFSALPALQVL